MLKQEQEELMGELLVEEGLENSIIEIHQTLIESDLKECFPPEQRETFNDLCRILFEESKSHREAVGKIIKRHEKHL